MKNLFWTHPTSNMLGKKDSIKFFHTTSHHKKSLLYPHEISHVIGWIISHKIFHFSTISGEVLGDLEKRLGKDSSRALEAELKKHPLKSVNPSYPIFSGWNFGFMQKLGRFGAFSPRRRRLLLPGPLRCFSNIASNVRLMCPRCIRRIWMGKGVLLGRCQKHTDAVRRKHPSRAMLWGSILAARCGVWRSKVWFDDVLVYGFCRWRVEVDWPTTRHSILHILPFIDHHWLSRT